MKLIHSDRFTSKFPMVSYSKNFKDNKFNYISKNELYKFIPPSHKDVLNKLTCVTETAQVEVLKKPPPKWFSKIPLSNVSANKECELLERSLGLSILQNYVDEEDDEDAGRNAEVQDSTHFDENFSRTKVMQISEDANDCSYEEKGCGETEKVLVSKDQEMKQFDDDGVKYLNDLVKEPQQKLSRERNNKDKRKRKSWKKPKRDRNGRTGQKPKKRSRYRSGKESWSECHTKDAVVDNVNKKLSKFSKQDNVENVNDFPKSPLDEEPPEKKGINSNELHLIFYNHDVLCYI